YFKLVNAYARSGCSGWGAAAARGRSCSQETTLLVRREGFSSNGRPFRVQRETLSVERENLFVERETLFVEPLPSTCSRESLFVEQESLLVEQKGFPVQQKGSPVQRESLRRTGKPT